MKKVLFSICLSVFLVVGSLSAFATPKDTFIVADIGLPESLDPAKGYDTSTLGALINIYETLITPKGAAADEYEGLIATEVPTVDNGGISKNGTRYTFKIRKGVKFHNGETLTPEDVVYSLKRSMVMDPNGGPMWMLLEAVTGVGNTRKDGKIVPGIFDKIDKAIWAEGNKVIVQLPKPYPPILGILGYSSGSILNKKWAIANGAWDGNIKNAAKYNDPVTGQEPLVNKTNGTGPYRLVKWIRSDQIIYERFEDYWGKKPQIKNAITKIIPEWSTRKLMLQNGDVDRAFIGAPQYNEVKAMNGVKADKLNQLSYVGVMFCQKVNTTANPYVGSGKLDGKGIPEDFFSNINIRKAFAHAYNHQEIIESVMNGLGVRPSSPNIYGMPYRIDVPIPEFDLAKTEKYLKGAYGGQLWKKGLKMTIAHNEGRIERRAAALQIAENIMSLNPKFHIELQPMVWSDYVGALRESRFAVFIIGWGADYPDPHNVIHPFMSSNGTYGQFLNYRNPEVDRLLDEGIVTAAAEQRRKIYERLQHIWANDYIGMIAFQATEALALRDNISGYYKNPLYGPSVVIFKDIVKD